MRRRAAVPTSTPFDFDGRGEALPPAPDLSLTDRVSDADEVAAAVVPESYPVMTDGVHLVCADPDKLHGMADRLELKREWYQCDVDPADSGPHHAIPHYDLTTPRALRRALAAGVRMCNTRTLLYFYRHPEAPWVPLRDEARLPVELAVSVQQPWAEALVREGKRLETRTWKPAVVNTKYPLYVAIHAGKKVMLEAHPEAWSAAGFGAGMIGGRVGAIVGVGLLAEAGTFTDAEEFDRLRAEHLCPPEYWEPGKCWWRFACAWRFEQAIPSKGALMLYPMATADSRAVTAALRVAQRGDV